MSKTILKVSDISKQYRLGLVGTGSLIHDLNRFWHRIRGKEDPYLQIGSVNDRTTEAEGHYVWALQDINFEVETGEVLGIIGKNGAGKSTLLKLLSRVTSPTTGVIKSKGRIASLLEVGTGFHQELTGRENIYLNGAILGMTKAEIKSKIDEIISFSGCELYIDTPVKRYSSGMTVRLAFAVAAHLEPDILVIDEVLAVGDAEFQKKAIGKMQDISKEDGRTVLFVSHNMAAVKSLCTRAMVLENGKISFTGNTDEAVVEYLKKNNPDSTNYIEKDPSLKTDKIEVHHVGVRVRKGDFNDLIYQDSEIVVEIQFDKLVEDSISINFRVRDEGENFLFTHSSLLKIDNEGVKGMLNYKMIIPSNIFNEGNFKIDVGSVHKKKFYILKENYLSFTVNSNSKKIGGYYGKTKGALKLNLDWIT
ncbi:MAG: ABC transporter ATP-binding protein [Flavobacteriaceae bacterium]|nr:ABC transporter ATP-binding protein [Flavobacteriaceae bacterium]